MSENRGAGAQVCRAARETVSAGPAASLQRNVDDRLWDQPRKAAILLVDKDPLSRVVILTNTSRRR